MGVIFPCYPFFTHSKKAGHHTALSHPFLVIFILPWLSLLSFATACCQTLSFSTPSGFAFSLGALWWLYRCLPGRVLLSEGLAQFLFCLWVTNGGCPIPLGLPAELLVGHHGLFSQKDPGSEDQLCLKD